MYISLHECFSPFQFSAQQRNRPFSSDQTKFSLQTAGSQDNYPCDQTNRQFSCYVTTRQNNFPVIRPPDKTTFLLSEHQQRPFSCQQDYHTRGFSSEQNTSLDHFYCRPSGQTTFRLSFIIQLQICTELPSSLQTCIQVRTYPHG